MSWERIRTLVVGAILVSSAALPGAALGQPPSIEKAGSRDFPQRAYTLQTPQRLALDPSQVAVSENGEAVDAVTVQSAAGGEGDSFGTVLVIDSSDSMTGRPIAEAMRAARAFADRRAPGQQLGVVTFNDRAEALLPITSEEGEIETALAETPRLGPSTHLYDATGDAIEMLADAGIEAGSIVVLSDGADTGSETTSGQVVEQAAGSGVRVFAVGLRSDKFDPQTLAQIAVGGSVADAAKPAELAAIFDRFGARLASQHLISYESEARPGDTVTVEVRVAGIEGMARAYYEAPAMAAAAAHSADQGFWRTRAAMIGAIALAAALFGIALFVIFKPQRETVRERLARFVYPYRADDRIARGEDGPEAPTGPLSRIARALEHRDWWVQFSEELEIAQIQASPVRIVAATIAAMGGAMVFISQVLEAPILIPLSLLVPYGVRSWVKRRLREQRREFAEQVGDNLQLVASALRAGQSMAGALAVVVEETTEPARTEFRRIVNDERLGVPLEDAIRDVARRMDNLDMEQVALVAAIQRETGGNTAEILDQVIASIRERTKLRRLMETLTAQGRLSQIVISALPVVLLGAMTLLNRNYMSPLFETSSGRIWLGIGAGLSVIGSLIIKRIVEVRV
jgi:tight adherence protein B